MIYEQITVYDCDMDVTSNPDNVSVVVSTSGGSGPPENETFVLLETKSSSGLTATFTGFVNVSTNKSYQGSGNGRIWTEALAWNGTVLKILYNDTYSSNSSASVLRTAISAACTTPSMYISQTIFGTTLINTKFATTGGTLNLLVYDGSQNKDATVVDRTTIFAFTLPLTSSSDMENVVLLETGTNTGAFTGLIGVSASDNRVLGDLELSPLNPGDKVNFTHAGCVLLNVSVTMQCVDLGTWIIDARPVPISNGRNLTITVSDHDLNTNSSVAQTYHNLVTLNFKGTNIQDSENISITENGNSSSIFTGSILVLQTTPVLGDGILEMDCSGLDQCSLSRTFFDLNFGPVTDTSATARRGIVQINASKPALGGSNFFIVGEPLNVTAFAGDASAFVTVQVVGAGNLSQTLVLSEVAAGTGIFNQNVQTAAAASASVQLAPTVTVYDGQTVIFTFVDPFPVLHASSASATGRYPGSFSIQPDPITRTRMQQNGSIGIALREKDLNLNASAINTVVVTVTTFAIPPLSTASSGVATTSSLYNVKNTTALVPTTTSKISNATNGTKANISSAAVCASSFLYLQSGSIQINLTETFPNSSQFASRFLLANSSKLFPGLLPLQSFMAFEVCFPETGTSRTTLPRLQRWAAVNSTVPILPPTLLGGSRLQITIQDGDSDMSWFVADSIKVRKPALLQLHYNDNAKICWNLMISDRMI